MLSLKEKLRLNNPWTQNFISGVILFLTVGIYLAVIGLGAGGGKPSSAHVATITYTSIYAIFAVTGFFGGSIMNTLGPRWTMTIGSLGYPLYIASLWYYDVTGNEWFPLMAGILGGAGAGLLWTVSGFIQFAYAEEQDKGTYIAWQLFLLALGSTVGALVAFGISVDEAGLTGVPTSVYLTFIIIMSSAILVSATMIVSPRKIIRDDGTHLAIFTATEFRSEFKGCVKLLKDWRIVALIVPMIATEMSSALIPTLSAYSFNLRTRSLNGVLFWAIQIPATFLYGLVLDNSRFRRRVRGLTALSIALVMVIISWTLSFIIQVKYHLKRDLPSPAWDWTDSAFVEFSIMVIFTGIAYAIDQMVVMWVISAFSNEPRLLARYGGFFKGMLSAGLCIAFGMESGKVSYLNQTITQSVLMIISFPILYYIVMKCVPDTNYFSEDNVIPPQHVGSEKAQILNNENLDHRTHSEGKADDEVINLD
ncbi:membrane transporter [Talaromyces proteolyticus]|uniref:Membrane transporter n=1 Tax=Talaromyces proteolyticus TaxID=1131652 RepID=A0AAD4PW93_9EURO|nr:membrane transporter [Talaromyces proteolyticus]KAH8694312.1 membrane transporter [Talaromyces proteolyticus]